MCRTVKEQIFRHSVNSIIKHSGFVFLMFKAILGQSELHKKWGSDAPIESAAK